MHKNLVKLRFESSKVKNPLDNLKINVRILSECALVLDGSH